MESAPKIEHIKNCKYCGDECYTIERDWWLNDDIEDRTDIKVKDWHLEYRLFRGCPEIMNGEKDDHRTVWTTNIEDMIRQWNEDIN